MKEKTEKTDEQITKDQHYVPQFYLRKFTNSEGKLEILNCELRKVVLSRTPKSVCNEEYFYSVHNKKDDISQKIEKALQNVEDKISKLYDGIVARIIDCREITSYDKLIISTFMSMQYLRGPYMRKQIKRMDESLQTQLAERGTVLERADNNIIHLRLLDEMEGFRNLLFHKDWLIYISKSSKKFVTSDNPVTEIFPEWTGKYFYGPSFMQKTHIFSLTPEILITARDQKRNANRIGLNIKRKTLFETEKDNFKILELNLIYPRNAIAYTYSQNKLHLQEMIDDANLYKKQQEDRFTKLVSLISHFQREN